MCNFILTIEKENTKALYRLGKSYELLNEYKDAENIFIYGSRRAEED